MKKLFLLLSSLFLLSETEAQQATKKTSYIKVVIDGEIYKFSGKTLYLHHKWENKDITDSAKVINGKFSFKLKSQEPNKYWFTTEKDANSQARYEFFADESPVRVKLLGDSLPFSQATGGQVQKEFMDYRTMINNFVMIQLNMQNEFNNAARANNVEMQNAIQNEYQNLNNQYLNGLKQFVKSHPNSPVSGYLILYNLGDPQIPIAEMEEALKYLDAPGRETQFAKMAIKRVEMTYGSTVGYPANNFSQPTPEGKMVNLSDFKGKYVLLDFWASWCRPCRMENPNVVAAYNRFKDKGFTILAVSLDQNKEQWVNAIKADNLTWTHVSDLKGWGSEVGQLYNVRGIPQNFLLDKDGKIIAKDLRGAALDEKLQEVLK